MIYLSMHAANRAQKIRKPSAKNPQTERKKSANRAQKIRKPSAKNPQTERKKSANRAQKIRKPCAKKSANRAQKIRKPSAKNPQTERKKSANRAQKSANRAQKTEHIFHHGTYMHIDHACDWTRLLYSTANASSATTKFSNLSCKLTHTFKP